MSEVTRILNAIEQGGPHAAANGNGTVFVLRLRRPQPAGGSEPAASGPRPTDDGQKNK
jgi:hypothetical protein